MEQRRTTAFQMSGSLEFVALDVIELLQKSQNAANSFFLKWISSLNLWKLF